VGPGGEECDVSAELTETLPLCDGEFTRELLSLVPHLRAFARTLAQNAADADDLAQDALAKAWAGRRAFAAGTNLHAWVFTILRNLYYSDARRSWRRLPLDQDYAERTLVAPERSDATIAVDQLRLAIAALPREQREALILVTAAGFSYDQAAAICGCAVGTVKSRVSRARESVWQAVETGKLRHDSTLPGQAMQSIMEEAARLGMRRRVA
jgi:RNA polymerase sigma-70 factor (ECF subfamily)